MWGAGSWDGGGGEEGPEEKASLLPARAVPWQKCASCFRGHQLTLGSPSAMGMLWGQGCVGIFIGHLDLPLRGLRQTRGQSWGCSIQRPLPFIGGFVQAPEDKSKRQGQKNNNKKNWKKGQGERKEGEKGRREGRRREKREGEREGGETRESGKERRKEKERERREEKGKATF